jgi:hypothetical protein
MSAQQWSGEIVDFKAVNRCHEASTPSNTSMNNPPRLTSAATSAIANTTADAPKPILVNTKIAIVSIDYYANIMLPEKLVSTLKIRVKRPSVLTHRSG